VSAGLFKRLFSLEGKAALVTGASGGIGRVLAVAFAEAGAKVGLHGIKLEKLETTRQFIERAGGKGIVVPAELRDTAACQKVISDARHGLGRLDVLVNCAGVNRRKPIRAVTEDDFDSITDINLRSVFFLSQAAHPIMREQGGGKIINIGSITSTEGLGGISVYGATKAAVAQLTKSMALEWAKDNIQVNCLAPGFIFTPLTEVGLWGDAHRKQWLLDRIPARRPGQPEELVGTALLLASNASSYITGQTINVDGGYLAGGSWLREEED
jgi:NAD(P)-dependent dehydrogenase (short-subunit alcohol dehydrogenase family)